MGQNTSDPAAALWEGTLSGWAAFCVCLGYHQTSPVAVFIIVIIVMSLNVWRGSKHLGDGRGNPQVLLVELGWEASGQPLTQAPHCPGKLSTDNDNVTKGQGVTVHKSLADAATLGT